MGLQVQNKKAIIFDLDNTLYPEKDYLYQIYYMIGQFVEYQETYEHEKVTKFLIDEFEKNGRNKLFDKLIERFSLDPSYMENFLRLMRTARLPLKLMLYKEMEDILNELAQQQKQIFILTNGNPQQQFNKIMQVEWKGLQHHIKCYFCDEIARKPSPDSMHHLLKENNLNNDDVLFIGNDDSDMECATAAGVEYMDIKAALTI